MRHTRRQAGTTSVIMLKEWVKLGNILCAVVVENRMFVTVVSFYYSGDNMRTEHAM